MVNWGVHGHDWAVERLARAIRSGRVRHAYLILGAESLGKETLARAFAMTRNCLALTYDDQGLPQPCGTCSSCRRTISDSHPDVLFAENDATTGTLRIEEIRRVTGLLAMKPFEAHYRVAIFRDFHRAREMAQDALLKTLEEPPPHAMIILLAPSIEGILPTITSRTQRIQLHPVSAQSLYDILATHYHTEDALARLLANVSGGRIGWALRALEDPDLLETRRAALDLLESLLEMNRAGRFSHAEELAKEKAPLIALLELWQTYWRDVLLIGAGSDLPLANIDREDRLRRLSMGLQPGEALAALNATRELARVLATTNANPRLALEVTLLDYPGLLR